MINQETRVIRPYTGVTDIANLFWMSKLYFGADACDAGGSVHTQLNPHEFLLTPVRLEWADDEASFEALKENIVVAVRDTGLPLSSVDIVVVGSSGPLKISEVLLRKSLLSLDELSRKLAFPIDNRPQSFSTPHSGFRVDVYLVLAKDLPPKALRPSRKGTWLAKTHFVINTAFADILDPPVPLTNELRERYSLGKHTMRYLHFGDHDVLMPSLGQEAAQFFVDEDILAQLNARPNSLASRMLQLQLAFDYMSGVITRASIAMQTQEADAESISGSLLYNVLRIIAGSAMNQRKTQQSLVSRVRSEPQVVISQLEHSINLMKASLEVIKEGTG